MGTSLKSTQALAGGDWKVIQRTPTLQQLVRIGIPPGLIILVLSSFFILLLTMMGLMSMLQNAPTEVSVIKMDCVNALMGTLAMTAAFRAFLPKRANKLLPFQGTNWPMDAPHKPTGIANQLAKT